MSNAIFLTVMFLEVELVDFNGEVVVGKKVVDGLLRCCCIEASAITPSIRNV